MTTVDPYKRDLNYYETIDIKHSLIGCHTF